MHSAADFAPWVWSRALLFPCDTFTAKKQWRKRWEMVLAVWLPVEESPAD